MGHLQACLHGRRRVVAAGALLSAAALSQGCFLYPFHETALAYEDAVDLPGARAFAHYPRMAAVGNDATVRVVVIESDLGAHATDIAVPGGATDLRFRALHPTIAGHGMLGLVIRNADHLAITRSVTEPVAFGQADPIESGVAVSRPDLVDITGDQLPDLVYARSEQPGQSTIVARANQGGFFPFETASSGPPAPVLGVMILEDTPQSPIIAAATANYVFPMRGDGALGFQFINQTTGASQPSPLGAVIDLGRRITGMAFLETDVAGLALTVSLADPPGIATLHRRPDGTFDPPAFYGFGADTAAAGATPDEAIDPIVADLNRDGMPDVAVARPLTDTVAVWRGGESGLIEPPELLPVEDGCAALTAGDVNLDFWPDLVATHPGPGAARVIFNNREGDFVARTPKPLGALPDSMIAGDFDGDAAADVLMFNSFTSLSLHRGDPNVAEDVSATPIVMVNPTNAARRPLPVRSAPALAARDAFAALLRAPGGRVVVHRLVGVAPALTPVVVDDLQWPQTETPSDYDVGDLDADGDDDLAVLVALPAFQFRIDLFAQDNAGQFQHFAQFPTEGTPVTVRLGEFVIGNLADVLTVQPSPSRARVHRSDGGASYTALPQINVFGGNQIDALAAADIGGDGDDDFLLASTSTTLPPFEASRIRVWVCDGLGSFADGALLPLSGPVASMTVGDVNADGEPDLAAYVRDLAATDTLTCWDLLMLPAPSCLSCSVAAPTAFHESCRISATGPAPAVALVNVVSSLQPDGAARPWLAFTDTDGAGLLLRTRPNLGALHAPCPGDLDGNRTVNFLDLNHVLSAFGQTGLFGTVPGDADLDGDCDFIDLNIVLSAFGTAC